MNFSPLNRVVSLLFPMTFVLFITLYEFRDVALFYALFMFGYLLFSLITKQSFKEIATPLIYFVFIVLAYFFNSFESIKLIPALLSSMFFLLFLHSFLHKKEMILYFTKKFYPKELDAATQKYLASSDGYWSIALGTNTLVQIALVFYGDKLLWAFYSSFGWYIYLFFVLLLQILYGKFYAIKNSDL